MENLFAERLKELRTKKELTQRQIAKLLNVSQISYLRWEQGKTQPSIESILKLCVIFDESADFLLGRENYDYSFVYEHNETKLSHKEKGTKK